MWAISSSLCIDWQLFILEYGYTNREYPLTPDYSDYSGYSDYSDYSDYSESMGLAYKKEETLIGVSSFFVAGMGLEPMTFGL